MTLTRTHALMKLGIVAKQHWPAIRLDGLHVIFAPWNSNGYTVAIPVGNQHLFIGDPEDIPTTEQQFEQEHMVREGLRMDGQTFGLGYGPSTNTVVVWMKDGDGSE